jgi:hypothetical protein
MPYLDTDLLGQLFSIKAKQSAMSDDQVTLENKLLENQKLRRDLSEPSSVEMQAATQQTEQQKFIFNSIKEIAMNTSTSPATRAQLFSQLESHYYTLPKDMQSVLEPILSNTPLDENQKKLTFFEQQYGTGPSAPVGKWGSGTPEDPTTIGNLPVNEATERNWAEYILKKSNYEYLKKTFLLGKDAASVEVPSQYVKILADQPATSEGGQPTTSSYWRLNPQTKLVERVPAPFANTDQEQAKKWGYSEKYQLDNDFFPTKEPIKAEFKGQTVQITDGVNSNNEPQKDIRTIGNMKLDVTGDNKYLSNFTDAMVTLGRGEKLTTKDPTTTAIYQKLESVQHSMLPFKNSQKYSQTDLVTIEADINRWVKRTMPGFNYVLKYDLQDPKNPQVNSNMVKVNGTEWGLIPVNDTIMYSNGQGIYHATVDGQDLYSDKIGKNIDPSIVKGTKTGDTMPAQLTVNTPENIPQKEEVSGNLTIGDVVTSAIKQLQITPEQKRLIAEYNRTHTDEQVTEEGFKNAYIFARDTLKLTGDQLNKFYYGLDALLNRIGSAMINIPIPGTKRNK